MNTYQTLRNLTAMAQNTESDYQASFLTDSYYCYEKATRSFMVRR